MWDGRSSHEECERVHVGIGNRDSQGHYGGNEQSPRRAVGYVRVSTDMQAAEGMSPDAQRKAIESYCAMMGIKLVKLCQDVMSGGKDVRPGLADALRTLQRLCRCSDRAGSLIASAVRSNTSASA